MDRIPWATVHQSIENVANRHKVLFAADCNAVIAAIFLTTLEDVIRWPKLYISHWAWLQEAKSLTRMASISFYFAASGLLCKSYHYANSATLEKLHRVRLPTTSEGISTSLSQRDCTRGENAFMLGLFGRKVSPNLHGPKTFLLNTHKGVNVL